MSHSLFRGLIHGLQSSIPHTLIARGRLAACTPLLFGLIGSVALAQSAAPTSTHPVVGSAKVAREFAALGVGQDDSAPKPATPDKPTTPEKPDKTEVAAKGFVELLTKGEFEKAAKNFDETMLKAMPAPKLKQTWSSIEQQSGKFQKQRAIRSETTKANGKEYKAVFVTCDFEKGPLDVQVVYAANGKVSGLFVKPAKPQTVGKEELWLGELDAGVKLRILVHLGKTVDGKLAASFDSLDQGQKGIPFDTATRENGKVKFMAKALNATYEGTVNEAGTEIEGEWKQGPGKFPLKFKLVDAPPQTNRPQLPKPPFPYKAIDLEYENAAEGIKIAGTLTVPPEAGPHPAVLLITGSGSQDRDETIFEHKPFLVLADYLTRRGIVVLRVDDRGVGGTTKGAVEATSADLAGDVRCGVEFLKQRPEVDPAKIGLMGHSEGGIIAPLVATQTPDVAFVVMLAGTSVTGEQVLYEQGAAIAKASGAAGKALAMQRELQQRMFSVINAEPDNDKAVAAIQQNLTEWMATLDDESKQALGESAETLSGQARRLCSPWFRYFLTYDPLPVLKKIRCPLLVLNGAKDLQVLPEQNLPLIREALAESKHPDYEIHELPNLNHLFQTSATGAVAEYGQIEETFAPSALKLVGDWITKRFAKAS
ncbi:MAG: alpha/beta fold hydrolase [Planctomycetes bacterium]|nr:alpha/beta fold hydrolase [Planctomycetota bacterium]